MTTDIKNLLTKQQITNLNTLATFLASLPDDYKRFEMRSFCRVYETSEGGVTYTDFYSARTQPCGAVACAVGHGPLAGIAIQPGEAWNEYSERVFMHGAEDIMREAWSWCFSGGWAHVDNTAKGAAARIRWLLEKGLPSNWESQMSQQDPLCYVDEAVPA